MSSYGIDTDAAAGRISVLDSAGTALLGAKPGDLVEPKVEGGTRRKRVREVVHQPEHSLRAHMVVRG